MTLATLVGYEPAPSAAVQEALFSDPLDDSCIPQLTDVAPVLQKKRRFPSLAALRAKAASSAALHAVCEETVVRVHSGCCNQKLFGLLGHKDELNTAANASTPKQEVRLATTQATHLAGAAVLGLRKHTRGASDSSIPRSMMQVKLSDAVPSAKISKTVKASMAPRPPLAAPWPNVTGNGKRPIPRNMQVFIVPVTC